MSSVSSFFVLNFSSRLSEITSPMAGRPGYLVRFYQSGCINRVLYFFAIYGGSFKQSTRYYQVERFAEVKSYGSLVGFTLIQSFLDVAGNGVEFRSRALSFSKAVLI